jgi:hypothetical protein
MRKLVFSTVLVGFMVTVAACDTPDPAAFETYTTKIKNNDERATAFNDLQRLAKSVGAGDSEERKQEFADKVIPVFAELWDDENAVSFRVQMLEMCRDMGRPEASVIWNKAVALDGSSDTRQGVLLALQGIRDAKATDSAEAVIGELDKTIDDGGAKDGGENAGEIRIEYAKTLGELRDKRATPVLIKALEQTKEKQPVAVHKEATKALELIGDPAATEALLAVSFRVPDAPGTQSIGERAKRALAAIGEPALPTVTKQLRGELTSVNELAAQNGVDVTIVQQTAAGILGAMGLKGATTDLVAYMPAGDCGEKPSEDTDVGAAGVRAFVARALGFIGDEGAVDALCGCRNATHNPGDLDEIVGAMGRIGGDKAFECLTDVVANGYYEQDAVANSDFVHEIRWESVRYLLMGAKPSDAPKIREVINGQKDEKVTKNMGQWEPGIKTLEECKDDKACYSKVLADTSQEWISREVAAVQLSRASMGDVGVAQEISKAFKVRSPDARVTMALLAARTADGKDCWECADTLEAVMSSEKGSADAKMQLAWLTARQSIAKLTRGARPGAATAAAAPAADAKPAEGEEKPAEGGE